MRTISSILLLSAALLTAGAATAQSSDKALAEALFQQGKQLFDQGKTDEACARFEESQRREPKLGTLLNLAVCHEKQGRTATAWAEFTEAAALAEKKGETARSTFARERVAALEAKQSKITVVLKGDAPGLVVIVDGKDFSVHGVALPVDPGRHRVEAKASGRKPWSTEIDVPPGPANLSVEVPELAPEDPAPAATPPPPTERLHPGTELPKPERPAPEPEREGIHPATWACFGIGGAGLLVGAIAGGVSLGMAGDLEESCTGGVCSTSAQRDDLSTANTLANVSNVGFGVGIAGVAAGVIVLLATLPSDEPERPVAVVPIGDVGAGLRVRY